MLGHGPYAVLYSVCDRVVDAYEAVAAELETDVDEIELSVFSDNRSNDSQRIYTLKREVAEFRRAVAPLREPLTRFAQCQVSGMPQAAGAFFRDVNDHALRVYEQIENLDSLLSSAHDAHMAQISVQQNDDMRKISAWVAIAAVPTMIAGIYGMNFEHMPELGWTYGYPIVVAVMLVICVGLFRLFKKSGGCSRVVHGSGGRDGAGGQESDEDRRQRHPVGDEPCDRVVGHELQQPRHGGIRDDEADDRGDDGGADRDVAVHRAREFLDARTQEGGDGQEERHPGCGRPGPGRRTGRRRWWRRTGRCRGSTSAIWMTPMKIESRMVRSCSCRSWVP